MTISKIYLAALYSMRPEMEKFADLLTRRGHEIVSTWVYGGEEGLSREDIAILDLKDVDKADTLICFTFPRGTKTPGGGRHVEFGYALAKGKRLVLIGERENVFHHWPNVEVYPTVDAWCGAMETVA